MANTHQRAPTNQKKSLLTVDSTIEYQSDTLKRAADVYEFAVSSVTSLLVLFTKEKDSRANVRGILTEIEQDLLRAALVFACAGLDSVIKHSTLDNLKKLIDEDENIEKEFAKFVERKLSQSKTDNASLPFLAAQLIKKDLRKSLLEMYVQDLVGNSLQSEKEITKVCNALGINQPDSLTGIQEVFRMRNEVIHEMDIALNKKPRKRINRSQDSMLKAINRVLLLASDFVKKIETKKVAQGKNIVA